jgi:hypothetical protein
MRAALLRSLVVAASFLLPIVVRAQVPTTRPTPEQAQILLQTRPDLVAQLRQRFATSGLTREQIHARLRAEGYPEDLLDPYLPGVTGTATAPSEDVFRAVQALGIADSSDVTAMQEAYESGVSPSTRPQLGSIVCVLDPYSGMRPAYDTVGQNLPPTLRSPTVPQLPGQYTMPGQILPGTPNAGIRDTSGAGASRAAQICPPGQVPMRVDSRVGQRGDSERGISRDSLDRIQANIDSGLVIFGLDVFRNSTTQFEPNLSGPVDANYRLGP